MAYTYKKKTAHSRNYGGKRSTSLIEYIVWHYTANDGDTDENNGIYFANNIVKASAHYFVDDDSVTQSVPDDYIAWAVGGSKYSDCHDTGGGKLYGVVTNTNSISIELCDDVRNGTVYPSAATIENALELTRSLMKKYNIPASKVIRHFDVTGKRCPAYWCGTDAKDDLWKSVVLDKLTGSTATAAKPSTKPAASPVKSKTATEPAKAFNRTLAGTYKVTAKSGLNVRAGAGTSKAKLVAIPKGTEVQNYGYYTTVLGVKWLYVQFTYGGVKYTGFCSKNYLARV